MHTVVVTILLLFVAGMITMPSRVVALSTDLYRISPYMLDINGEDLSAIVLGRPVMLHLEVHNNQAQSNTAVMVYEIRNSDGFTVYLGWQGVTVGPNGSSIVSQSWLPPKVGE